MQIRTSRGPRALSIALALAFVMASMGTAEARPHRPAQVPNGTVFSCATCHDPSPPVRNLFGQLVEANLDTPGSTGNVQWSLVFDADSDADSYTNGGELGDPTGMWTTGDPNPTFVATNPGDDASFPVCGDGGINGTPGEEQCDGDDLGGMACEDFDLPPGTLACDTDCLFDIEGCFDAEECGNDIAEGFEDCDGDYPTGAPGMDGFALAEHLRGAEKTRLVPLIFLAAPEVGEQRLVEGYRKGAVDVLAEPCDPDILRAKVGVFVALARQRAELEDPRAPRTAVGERGASHELRASEERLKRAQAVAEVGLLDWNVETGEMVWSEPRAREV